MRFRFRSTIINIPAYRKDDGTLDITGLSLCGMICSMQLYPHLIIPIGLANNINPYKFAVTDLLGPTAIESPIMLLILAALGYIIHFEAIRMIPFLMITLFFPILLMTEVLNNLSEFGGKDGRFREVIGYVQVIQLQLRLVCKKLPFSPFKT